jgi:hypothetical protein
MNHHPARTKIISKNKKHMRLGNGEGKSPQCATAVQAVGLEFPVTQAAVRSAALRERRRDH